MADLDFKQRRDLRRLAEDAIHAANRHYGPFVDAVAHPLNIIALLDMADRAPATPSPPVAAPPATTALTDEQIGAICDQFKTLIRQKREVHIRRGLDAGADYYIGDVANYVGHAVKEAANARIAELVAENKMLSRSLDESLFVDLQCVAERAAAQPQPQPAQPLTDKDLDAEIERLSALKKERATAFFEARIGLPCSRCSEGKYQGDWNGYSQFHRCDKCHHVPMWNGDSEWLAPGITAPSTPTPPEVAP